MVPPQRLEIPIAQLMGRLTGIKNKAQHSEMWGVELGYDSLATRVILIKFLRANDWVVSHAADQLVRALQWRKMWKPLAQLAGEHERSKFDGFGYVTVHRPKVKKEGREGAGAVSGSRPLLEVPSASGPRLEDSPGSASRPELPAWTPPDDGPHNVVVTWNLYGAIKKKDDTFGDLNDFIRYRIALMELGIQTLGINNVREALDPSGEDPFRIIQVHDHPKFRSWALDARLRTISAQIMLDFAMAYPETVARKFMVNVPRVMDWTYAGLQFIIPSATFRKVKPLSSRAKLGSELKSIRGTLPEDYGGEGPGVTNGLSPLLGDSLVEVFYQNKNPVNTVTSVPQDPSSTGGGGSGGGGGGGGATAPPDAAPAAGGDDLAISVCVSAEAPCIPEINLTQYDGSPEAIFAAAFRCLARRRRRVNDDGVD
ncbi:hypothetical protein CP533_4615, partial [Ophiocordyceps camponoti-saundersi (nom. inval.)]